MKGTAIEYSDAEKQWVSDNRTLLIQDLYAGFCQEFSRVDVSAVNLNALRKRNSWKTGRTGQYAKGNVPHPLARPKGPNKTSFKQGNCPHNHQPVGTERLSKDGYLQVKTAEPKQWEFAHHIIWQQHNGAIPAGSCVIFTNGDKTDVTIGNLQLVTRSELVRANQLAKDNPHKELRPTFIGLGKLVAKAHQRKGAA